MSRLSFIPKVTATRVTALPEGGQWLYELKLDGYRALLPKDGGKVRIVSRNEKDLTASYPGIAKAAARLNASSAVLDGEVVALDASGRPSFQALQNRAPHPSHALTYFAFDLLHLDGRDLRREPLDARRRLLLWPGQGRGPEPVLSHARIHRPTPLTGSRS